MANLANPCLSIEIVSWSEILHFQVQIPLLNSFVTFLDVVNAFLVDVLHTFLQTTFALTIATIAIHAHWIFVQGVSM
jgi:hypothetical protein